MLKGESRLCYLARFDMYGEIQCLVRLMCLFNYKCLTVEINVVVMKIMLYLFNMF